ncbi:MAG: LuxR family transcriptional regulator [Alphaproteobacteria bacterium]|nr:LuxR family transcriptional regulator [Alphaproteobacteria bacterium]
MGICNLRNFPLEPYSNFLDSVLLAFCLLNRYNFQDRLMLFFWRDKMQKLIHGQDQDDLIHPKFFKKTISINGNLISLSGREFQCLELLAHGKRVKEVARCLEISSRTVESYVEIIRKKSELFFRGSITDLYWNYFREPPTYLFYSVRYKDNQSNIKMH